MFIAIKKYGFYALAGAEVLLLFGLIVQYAGTPQSGSDSGGGEMGLFFFILFPLAILSITVLTYRFAASRVARVTAAIILILMLVSMMYLFLRDGLPVAA